MTPPPTTSLAADRGFRTMASGRDHVRYLQTGIVATDAAHQQKHGNIARFLRSWSRAVNYYQADAAVMIPYIRKNSP